MPGPKTEELNLKYSSDNMFSIWQIFILCFISAANLLAAQNYQIANISHEVNNHEIEIRELEERLKIQETILDSIHQDYKDIGNSKNLEGRVGNLESTLKQVVDDIREFKQQHNSSAKILGEYKQKIVEQDKQIKKLQDVLNTLVDALQIDVNKSSQNSYVVQSGDSLEKIARRNKITIRQLKELNNLKNDRIFAGQKLKLP